MLWVPKEFKYVRCLTFCCIVHLQLVVIAQMETPMLILKYPLLCALCTKGPTPNLQFGHERIGGSLSTLCLKLPARKSRRRFLRLAILTLMHLMMKLRATVTFQLARGWYLAQYAPFAFIMTRFHRRARLLAFYSPHLLLIIFVWQCGVYLHYPSSLLSAQDGRTKDSIGNKQRVYQNT